MLLAGVGDSDWSGRWRGGGRVEALFGELVIIVKGNEKKGGVESRVSRVGLALNRACGSRKSSGLLSGEMYSTMSLDEVCDGLVV